MNCSFARPQIRERQLRNQAQLEVEDAVIGMRRARASYQAAVQTTKLQEESLQAEQIKFMEGASTSFFVIQYQSYLAQARSTELAAKGAYLKARAALQRAVGSILDDNGVSFDAGAARQPVMRKRGQTLCPCRKLDATFERACGQSCLSPFSRD